MKWLPPVGVLGIPWRLLQLAACVVCMHGLAAVFAEMIFNMAGFRFGWFYTLMQCFTYFSLVLLKRLILGGLVQSFKELRTSAFRALLVGTSLTVSHGCGVASFVHINYTTAMLFKSAKVPSVMLGGMVINQQRPGRSEVFWAITLTLGLFLFGLGDRMESPRFSVIGILLVVGNLCGSSITSNLQQRVLQRDASATGVEQLLFAQYAVASVILLVFTAATGELGEAMTWYMTDGRSKAIAVSTADNILSFLGLEAVFRITGEFDATRANVVCSCRKVFTFICSFWLFPKPFGLCHGLGLVLAAIGSVRLTRSKAKAKATDDSEDNVA